MFVQSAIGRGKQRIVSRDKLSFVYLRYINLIPLRSSLDICEDCANNPDHSTYRMMTRLVKAEKKVLDLETVCRSCSGVCPGEDVSCTSQDCSVYYSRVRQTSLLAFERENTLPVLRVLDKKSLENLEW